MTPIFPRSRFGSLLCWHHRANWLLARILRHPFRVRVDGAGKLPRTSPPVLIAPHASTSGTLPVVYPAVRAIIAGTSLAVMVMATLTGCATSLRNLDAEALWESTERRHPAAIGAVVERHRLESDYATIIRLSRDGTLRGQAFVRLAQLNVVLGEYGQARQNLEQSLRAGPPPERRRQALLMLGDLMERHLGKKERAVVAYVQIVNEYPGTPEAELATLRLEVLNREP